MHNDGFFLNLKCLLCCPFASLSGVATPHPPFPTQSLCVCVCWRKF